MNTISNKTHRVAIGALFLLQGLIFSTWASRIPAIKEYLNLNDAQLGTALFAIPFGQLVTMSLSGMFVSRFGSKLGTTIGSLVYPLMLIAVSFANSQYTLMLGLFFCGMGANMNNISINTQALGLEHAYGRSIMSTFHGVWSASGFFGGLIGAAAIANCVSVRVHFFVMALVSMTIYFFARPFLLSKDPNNEDSSPDDANKKRGYLNPTPYIITLGFLAFASMSCEGAMFNWTGIYFESIVGVGRESGLVSLGFICFMSTMAGGRFVADRFVTRFGAIRVIRASGAIIFTGMLIAIIFPYIITSAIGFMLVGIGVSGVVPTCYSLAGRSRRMKMSVALSCVCTIGFFGFIFGPPLIGYIAYISNLRISFLVMALIGLSLFITAPRLRTHVDN